MSPQIISHTPSLTPLPLSCESDKQELKLWRELSSSSYLSLAILPALIISLIIAFYCRLELQPRFSRCKNKQETC